MTPNLRSTWIGPFSLMAVVLSAISAHAEAPLYKEHCAKCHARAGTLATNLKGQTAEEKASRLEAFLQSHHANDPQVRARIIAYLIELSKS